MTAPDIDPFAVLAAILLRDDDTVDLLAPQVDVARAGLALDTAFLLAVDHWFGAGSTASDVTRFVAGARQQFEAAGDEFNPYAAERVLRTAALGDEDPEPGLDQSDLWQLKLVLLDALVVSADWHEAQITAFLDEARQILATRANL